MYPQVFVKGEKAVEEHGVRLLGATSRFDLRYGIGDVIRTVIDVLKVCLSFEVSREQSKETKSSTDQML